ncbi:hypothetical protein [Flocculibacter collagenilyticus]|uniref:hypothetical protein n=1 Tax=Flocculibacter collagenilyticus TaxID=2744479 RepID=UPI0018F5C755|nr:hypothetical protein [Flocculibacter collagenilyticus]
MVMFGEQQLYVSHLGLYHFPHDYQIILPVKLSDNDEAETINLWRKTYKGLITIKPEIFNLSLLFPHHNASSASHATTKLTTITVDIYEGHFERGGVLKWPNVQLTLDKAIIFRPLQIDSDISGVNYYVFGDKQNSYMVYQIGARPDRDHILKISGLMHFPFQKNHVKLVTSSLAKQTRGEDFQYYLQQTKIGDTFKITLNDEEYNVKVEKNIYFETADFSF